LLSDWHVPPGFGTAYFSLFLSGGERNCLSPPPPAVKMVDVFELLIQFACVASGFSFAFFLASDCRIFNLQDLNPLAPLVVHPSSPPPLYFLSSRNGSKLLAPDHSVSACCRFCFFNPAGILRNFRFVRYAWLVFLVFVFCFIHLPGHPWAGGAPLGPGAHALNSPLSHSFLVTGQVFFYVFAPRFFFSVSRTFLISFQPIVFPTRADFVMAFFFFFFFVSYSVF